MPDLQAWSTNQCGGRVVFSPISSLPPHLNGTIAMMYKLGKNRTE